MTALAPLIGLTGRRRPAGQLQDVPASLSHLEIDSYFSDYARAVVAAGGLPVHLPLDVDPTRFAGRLNGVIFSGGADVDSNHYDAPKQTDEPLEPIRDEYELGLLSACWSSATPVLGVCRGLQLINVFAGGTLNQDVESHARYDGDPRSTVHDIETAEGTTLRNLYGPTHDVNSLHHQTIANLGDGLHVTATHAEVVEGIEHESLPIVAVQWHPELLATRDVDPVFQWLVTEAARCSAQRS